MKVLCIGNSFSHDATTYLYQIARADKVEIEAVNMYIGGCSLERHYRNMLSQNPEYEIGFNGILTGFKTSLKDGLLSRDWDYVTVQQASHFSCKEETYFPYVEELVAYVRKCVPHAKVLVHQTWAYEEGSRRLTEELGYKLQSEMYNDLKAAYDKAAKQVKADGIIPSGEVFQELIKADVTPVHRDTFHASLGIGRLALGYTWYKYLTGNDVTDNTFRDFDEPVSEENIKKIKECVMKVVK